VIGTTQRDAFAGQVLLSLGFVLFLVSATLSVVLFKGIAALTGD
jgi:hypothetical protein